MKTLSASLQNHLSGDTTIATLIKITRADGTILGFTTHDRDLVIAGVTYVANGSFSTEKLESDAALKTNDFEALGLLQSDLIDEQDLRSGLYDHARIDVYLCNWADASQGTVQLRRGWLGEVKIENGSFKAELRGFHDLLQRTVGNRFTPECRHDLGCALCGVSLSPVLGKVSLVSSRSEFCDGSNSSTNGLFDYGLLTWTSGANKGLSMEVKSWDLASYRFTLWLPMPNDIAVGDAYSVVPGCDKKFSTCQSKFNNAINFGGFPHLPGLSKILQYPESS
jgi:uncharacterized phage protein (TIGR02218 family)